MEPRRNEFAIASLLMGIVSFVQLFNVEKPIAAVILGIFALKSIKRHGESGRKLAMAGIILAILSATATIILTVKYFPNLQQLQKQMQQNQ